MKSFEPIKETPIDDKWVKHITKEGALYHVISYGKLFDGNVFRRCSTKNCIINRRVYTERGAVEPLLRGETVEVMGVGNSMTPILMSKQIVTVAPVAPNTEFKKGDIVLVKVNGNVYLHLIKAVTPDQVQIGNNHGKINGWTKRKNVYGRINEKGNN